jgi:hypothetical protein
MIERDLFGTGRLVRHCVRIVTTGQELVEVLASEIEDGQALEALAEAKRGRVIGTSRAWVKPLQVRPASLTCRFRLFLPALVARIARTCAGAVIDGRIARRLRILAVPNAVVAFDPGWGPT